MNEPRRLHPLAAFIQFLKTVRELILPLALFFIFGGEGEGKFVWFKYAVLVITLLGTLMGGLLSWYRYTYRIEQGELRIEYGIFVRKRRYIPRERIQTIHVSAGIIQRLFGLVKLQIETARGGNEAEAVLTAITKAEADRIKSALLADDLISYAQMEDAFLRYEATMKELVIAASTSGSIGVVLSAGGAFFGQFDELIPYELFLQKFQQFTHLNMIIISLIVLFAIFLVWFISIFIMVAKYGHFTVVKNGDDLTISRGLLEKRQFNIPIARIQAIRIAQNPLRQLFGYAAVYVESAGGLAEKESNYSTVLFPLVKVSKVNELLSMFVPHYSVPASFERLPSRALRRYIWRSVLPAVVLLLPISYFFQPWGYLLLLLVVPFAFLGYMRFKDAGVYMIDEHSLSLRYRVFTKMIVLLRKRRIQTLESSQSIFQRKQRLATVHLFIQSGLLHSKHFKVVDIDEAHMDAIQKWYRKR
ncbi:putative membrane protein [Anoxybacillus vitaminiphilus]|uniref:Putative membrane protein n=1 Tax=Paranoxybacillus vitaminiphilus TaxID=581036 RepID=A0A327Y5X3_9BACL|nr:PH domain-containing protein [Anoxybacillus vitaminiphilus]RAK15682.1 putative membrane protein [Anoxybacillus vitaminiphilus]